MNDILQMITSFLLPELSLLIRLANILKIRPDELKKVIARKPKAAIARINKLNPAAAQELAKMLGENMKGKLPIVSSISKASKRITSLPERTRKILGNVLTDPSQVSKELGQVSSKDRKEISQQISEATDIDETKSLSSSWIIRGHYKSTGIGVGELTITTKQGRSYSYPGVPYAVWTAMKQAKGRNGSGAGSVFWALYLRGFSKSNVAKLLKKLGKISGVQVPETNINKLRK